MKLILVRHAEAAGDPHATPPRPVVGFLSPAGVRQAGVTAAALAGLGIEHLMVSPYGRCLQTAEVIAAAAGAPPIAVHAWLREWLPEASLRDLPSTRFEEMMRRDGERYVEETWKTELGEGCYEMHARIVPPLYAELAALGLRRRLGGWVPDAGAERRTIAIVAHGGSLGVVVSALLGLPPFPIAPVSFQLAGVATITFTMRRGIGYPHLVVHAPG